MYKLLRRRTISSLIDFAKISNRQHRKLTSVANSKKIRNIGIIAHIDAGKTTTTERMLYYSGFTNMMGEVHDGDTVMDFMPQERERGITIASAAITFQWRDHKINLIDTPGHVDFTIEVERSMSAIDGGVIILDSSSGVEVQTLTVWKQASRHGVPCIVYLNKMDKPNADFNMSLSSIEHKLKVKPLVLHLPIGSGKTFKGVVDLVSQKKILWEITNDCKDGSYFKVGEIDKTDSTMQQKREQLMEDVADLDDVYANKLILDGPESLTVQDLHSAIRRLTLKRAVVPVLCGSSYKNIGVQLLMDAVILYLPKHTERTRGSFSNDNELHALVFKIIHDKKRGPLTFIRLYSGQIEKNKTIYNINRKKYEKISNLMVPLADDFQDVSLVTSGNIAVVAGLKEAITGDTFIHTQADFDVARLKNTTIQVPDPVFFCTIEPPSLGAEKQLQLALQCLQREDPTFTVEQDNELGQTIISGMGELHIEVMKERILREYGVASYLGPLQVAYRETVSTKSSYTYTLDKNLGGTKHFVKIILGVYPNPNCSKFTDVKVVVTKENELGTVRSDYLKSINQGIRNALTHGPVLGSPVIDVEVSLLWLEVGRGTSSSMISAAASHCISSILKHSKLVLLEPFMKLSISCAPNHVGKILNNLSQKRSQILNMEVLSDIGVVLSRTPLSELRGYSTALRAITSGTCSLSMEFDGYEKMTAEEQVKTVEEVTGFTPL